MGLYSRSYNSFLVSHDWSIPGWAQREQGNTQAASSNILPQPVPLPTRGLPWPSMGTAGYHLQEEHCSSTPSKDRIQHTLHLTAKGQGLVCPGKRQGQQFCCPTLAFPGRSRLAANSSGHLRAYVSRRGAWAPAHMHIWSHGNWARLAASALIHMAASTKLLGHSCRS